MFPLLAGCGRSAGHREPRASPLLASQASLPASAPKLRVIQPRETPRAPFDLRLEAEMLDGESCQVRLLLLSARGGTAAVEFDLPDEVAATEGALRRECALPAGVRHEERLVVRVPAGGHRLLAAAAEMEGRRAEAFLEFGDPPTAAQRGLRTRSAASGEGVLRIGPEELGK